MCNEEEKTYVSESISKQCDTTYAKTYTADHFKRTGYRYSLLNLLPDFCQLTITMSAAYHCYFIF